MELPKLPFYKKHSQIFKAIIAGGILGLIYAAMYYAGLDFGYLRLLLGTVIGIFIGFIIITLEKSLSYLNDYSFIAAILLKAVIYSISILIFLLLFAVAFNKIAAHISYEQALSTYVNDRLFKDFLFSLGASIFLILFLEISSLLSPGFFYNYFTGRYHRPVQEERIFMFVDVQSSTTMAEQLGDVLYSKLLQDLFNDFTDSILASRAEIYQYAGDEIILTWKASKGINENRCLYCFYLLKQSIRNKQDYYLKTYKTIPKFKAGMHIGNAVTNWVGKVKKEIVYHGDLLNTTSRIQCKCNEFNHDFVISENMKNALIKDSSIKYEEQGEIVLRGKAKTIKLFTVDFDI
ncbi:adenylate cyclase [Flavobacterium sp. HSC-32F16]|uniref:adenylate/guanylate cyclase domain-containing protein n=1 Tax=Flavobacterium sp. HSC-32F16 TaxID=2910964 RepID=UPI0020A3DC11|nr:adenylate/guanylate cyclase domain-containing protein [Flavobacterium sp. HSC-32F16]MCP2025353.1 adenylate cyclase [Flavobacterium sp. HSC-32F16]